MKRSAIEAVQCIVDIVGIEYRDLACDFFLVFSRFEYALKQAGFVKPGRYGEASADWQRFAEDNDSLLHTNQDEGFCSAVKYIKSCPPKKQVISHGKLDWKEDNSDKFNLKRILDLVRRIRNNLFHGGKSPKERELSRDRQLLESGLVILQGCLDVDERVKKAFFGDLDQEPVAEQSAPADAGRPHG